VQIAWLAEEIISEIATLVQVWIALRVLVAIRWEVVPLLILDPVLEHLRETARSVILTHAHLLRQPERAAPEVPAQSILNQIVPVVAELITGMDQLVTVWIAQRVHVVFPVCAALRIKLPV
jgi:hypothetical protein